MAWPAASPVTSPPVAPGATADIEIHGENFQPGMTVTSTSPTLTVNSWSFVDWNLLRANITVASTVGDGLHGLLNLMLPGGAFGQTCDVAIASAQPCGGASDTVPPAEVRLLHVDKTRGAAPYLFSWQPVTLDRDGRPEMMGTYELSRSDVPQSVTGAWVITPATSYPFNPPADSETSLLYFYLVRARDAAGNLGP